MPPKQRKDNRQIMVKVFGDVNHIEPWLNERATEGQVDILNVTPLPAGQGGGIMVITRITNQVV